MNNYLAQFLTIPLAYAQTAKNGDAEFDALGYIFDKLPLWITAGITLVVAIVIASSVKAYVENRLASKMEGEHQEVLIMTGRMTFLTVAVIGITISLAIAGIDLTAMLAAIGFGLSFGMQDVISNFVAGLGILASRPFSIGDWINVNDKIGKVMEIKTRATILKTFDGLRLIVPNSELYKSSVLSYTSNSTRRIKVYAYSRYCVKMEDVYKIIDVALKEDNRILLEPKPSIIISELGDSYIELEVRFWVDSRSLWKRAQSELSMKIETRLEEAGLDAPYPVTSLSLEPDAEDIVLKTRQLDPKELEEIRGERKNYDDEFSKARKRYTVTPDNTQPMKQMPEVIGSEFLQVPQFAPAMAPAASPATVSGEEVIPGAIPNASPDIHAPAPQPSAEGGGGVQTPDEYEP